MHIFCDKVVTGRGGKTYEVKKIGGIKSLNLLPEMYLLEQPNCYYHDDSLCITGRDNIKIKVGTRVDKDSWEDIVEILKKCAENLKECSKKLKELRKEWCGTVEFYID